MAFQGFNFYLHICISMLNLREANLFLVDDQSERLDLSSF